MRPGLVSAIHASASAWSCSGFLPGNDGARSRSSRWCWAFRCPCSCETPSCRTACARSPRRLGNDPSAPVAADRGVSVGSLVMFQRGSSLCGSGRSRGGGAASNRTVSLRIDRLCSYSQVYLPPCLDQRQLWSAGGGGERAALRVTHRRVG